MAVPNTLLLEKWAVADWDWNETVNRKAHKTQQFYSTHEIYIVPGRGGTPLHKLYRYVRGAKGYGFGAFLVWNRA